MPRIGDWIRLVSVRERTAGVWLDAGPLGEILLPRREMPQNHRLGDGIDVFLHTDSEDRPVATARCPRVLPGSWGMLRCVSVSKVGAFVDWGLAKDLLVPFGEQATRMSEGKSYPVWVKLDEVSQRIIGTTRIARQLGHPPHRYRVGDAVKFVIIARTKLGYQAIVGEHHIGMLFADQVFEDLRIGEQRTGYIANVRDDRKIDLSLNPPGRARIGELEQRILTELSGRGGFWAIGDHSSPEEIRDEVGVSKRALKQAIGSLLKQKRISAGPRGIRLLP